MAYTPVPTRPNTPGIQQLPTGRFSAPFSRRAPQGRGGLQPPGEEGVRLVWSFRRLPTTTMATSHPLFAFFTAQYPGQCQAMGKGPFIEAELHYKHTKAKVAGLVFFFALKLITIARRVVRRMYSPGGSGYAIARARFYHAASRTRAYTPTPQTVPTHSFADVRR